MEKLNVAIADDNEKMLDLLGNLINEDKELELVGHANNGADIYDIIRKRTGCCTFRYYHAESRRADRYGKSQQRYQFEKTPGFYYCICCRTRTDYGGRVSAGSKLLYPEAF